ncbi:hypothetical protein BS50DRAFT_326948 [Corynespora cassiicola Philippines]|uniref:Uncharacterized protein n=1 Tax=Corynespora cassiicola Philippines TaxID=1448308 RepID=A0A2T2NU10_CORCC|nr:hypothetical protein BS50DRAFT_326948 [Corynespora cassiicola Philippines]
MRPTYTANPQPTSLASFPQKRREDPKRIPIPSIPQFPPQHRQKQPQPTTPNPHPYPPSPPPSQPSPKLAHLAFPLQAHAHTRTQTHTHTGPGTYSPTRLLPTHPILASPRRHAPTPQAPSPPSRTPDLQEHSSSLRPRSPARRTIRGASRTDGPVQHPTLLWRKQSAVLRWSPRCVALRCAVLRYAHVAALRCCALAYVRTPPNQPSAHLFVSRRQGFRREAEPRWGRVVRRWVGGRSVCEARRGEGRVWFWGEQWERGRG